ECPGLFPLKVNGGNERKWILTVNNGGSPAGSGGTQYFIGKFDGHAFIADDNKTRWLDGGADEYAGIIWNNTGDRTIFIGWMNNWPPANNNIPSYIWRGGMTLPMELSLQKVNDSTEFVIKQPVKELRRMEHTIFTSDHVKLSNGTWIKSFPGDRLSSSMIKLTAKMNNSQKLIVSLQNDLGQYVDIGYDKQHFQLVIDRTHAGKNNFHAESAPKHAVEIPGDLSTIELTIFYDRSTLEVFFDNGRWVTTDLVFPSKLYDQLKIEMPGGSGEIKKLQVARLSSVWK
ncbi:MAG TPA: GH32 C-terminal domain-containing protein, partial [Chitinophagaceae bacterium]